MRFSTVLSQTLLLAALSPSVANASWPADRIMPITLEQYRDNARPLLVFAPSSEDRRFLAQAHIFAGRVPLLRERDVLLFPIYTRDESPSWSATINSTNVVILAPAEATGARRRFHIAPTSFTVILIGKDGREKLRSSEPLTFEKLRDMIDSMPLRKQETRNHSNAQ